MSTRSDPGSLDELALGTGADIRSPLLRALVDLYLQKPKHSAEETQHFTELVLRLLDQADNNTCIAVRRRLASYPSVPSDIMGRLTNDASDISPDGRERAVPSPDKDPVEQEWATPAELSDLFFTANAAERRLILDNLVYAHRPGAAAISGDAREAARQLETAALAHNPDAFVRALGRWLGIAPALARRIVRDPLGEPIVIAAKVIGIASDALQRILLFINPAVGRSVARVYELAALFETIDAEAARVMVAIWRAADPQPVTAPVQPGAGNPGTRRSTVTQSGHVMESPPVPAGGNRYSTTVSR